MTQGSGFGVELGLVFRACVIGFRARGFVSGRVLAFAARYEHGLLEEPLSTTMEP